MIGYNKKGDKLGMTYINIGGALYPAKIRGTAADKEWNGRESKSVTIEMDCETAKTLFVDGAQWSIVMESALTDENGDEKIVRDEYDNSEYAVAGDIIDHRTGELTVKMGKQTDLEMAYELLYGGEA